MDLGAAKTAGISFFTHKLTEGTTTKHQHGGVALARARDAGVPFLGGYMVPRTPGNGGNGGVAAQVDYLVAWADQLVPWWRTFPGWFWQMDTEHWSYDAVSAATGHQAAQLLAQRTGKHVLHYAPEWAYGNSVPAGEALWASNYISGSGDFRTLAGRVPASKWAGYSGRVPAVLQYTSSAVIGRQPGCDANLFQGALADFAALIGVAAPTSTTPAATTGDHDMLYRIRDGGDLTGAPAGTKTSPLYQPTGRGPVAIDGAEWQSVGSPPPMLLGSWARLQQLCPPVDASVGLPDAQFGALQAALVAAVREAAGAVDADRLEQVLLDVLGKVRLSAG